MSHCSPVIFFFKGGEPRMEKKERVCPEGRGLFLSLERGEEGCALSTICGKQLLPISRTL